MPNAGKSCASPSCPVWWREVGWGLKAVFSEGGEFLPAESFILQWIPTRKLDSMKNGELPVPPLCLATESSLFLGYFTTCAYLLEIVHLLAKGPCWIHRHVPYIIHHAWHHKYY